MRARTLTTAQRSDSEKEMQTSCGEWEAGRRKPEANQTSRDKWSQDQATKKSSYKERRVDAKAPYADEGRGQLRKASGSCKQA